MTRGKIERKTYDSLAAGEKLRPIEDKIIVKVLPLKLSDTILANWDGSAVRGEVIAVGPGKYPTIHRRGTRDGKPYHTVHRSNHFQPTVVKIGQIVHLGGMEIGGYAFPRIYINHEEHILATEQDVAGIEQ